MKMRSVFTRLGPLTLSLRHLSLMLLSGVAFSLTSTVCSADTINLIQNGGFETNNCPVYCNAAPPWVLSYPAEIVNVDSPHSGNYHLHLGSGSPFTGTASQWVDVPRDGLYKLSFWYLTDGEGPFDLIVTALQCCAVNSLSSLLTLAWTTRSTRRLASRYRWFRTRHFSSSALPAQRPARCFL